MFSCESGLAVPMVDGQSILPDLQPCLLTAPVLTRWAPGGMKLAVAVLSNGNFMLFFGSVTPR